MPTEEIVLKNNFENSIAIGEKSIFFLNTYGSLYSVNIANSKIEWFLNLNPSLDLNVRNQFISNPVILYENILIVSTLPYLYVLNANNGSTIFKRPITSIVKPIVSGKNLFLITKDYLLVCIDLITNNIEYSININKEVAKHLNTKEKLVSIKSFEILNNKLHIFLESSFILVFEPTGKIENVSRLKTKIKSYPIFVDGSILYINNKNQLVTTN